MQKSRREKGTEIEKKYDVVYVRIIEMFTQVCEWYDIYVRGGADRFKTRRMTLRL